MWILILITLLLINLGGFLFPELDIWHAQGFTAQICFLVMFSWTFFQRPRRFECPNWSLGLVHFGVGINVAVLCYGSFLQKKYNIQNFYPYFNFLCLLMFYRFVQGYLTRGHIETIFRYLKYATTVTLFVCVLQALGLGQFFVLITPDPYHNNLVTGFIGNGTHLSGFLSSMIPLYLYEPKRVDILSLVLLGGVLTMAGTTVGDPSLSGFIITPILIAAYLWYFNRSYMVLFLLILTSLVLILASIKGAGLPRHLFETNGRISVWKFYGQVFMHYPITGIGLGKINQIYQMTPHPGFRHLHLEAFQFLVELGIIVFTAICNLIYRFFVIKPIDQLELCLKLCVSGFLLSSLFNYSAHLWLPSVYAMFFYSSLIFLNSREEDYGLIPQRTA